MTGRATECTVHDRIRAGRRNPPPRVRLSMGEGEVPVSSERCAYVLRDSFDGGDRSSSIAEFGIYLRAIGAFPG